MSNKNIFIPFTGIQDIQFSRSRSYIRSHLGKPDKCFHRGLAGFATDFYEERGIFVEYNAADLCEAIEFSNYSNLFHNNVDLLQLKYAALTGMYNSVSFKKEEEAGKGIIFLDLGFGVSKETTDSDNIESIIIFSEDYWLE